MADAPISPSLEERLFAFGRPEVPTLTALTDLVATIRPARETDTETAVRTLRAICHLLSSRPDLRATFRTALLAYLGGRRSTSLYVDAGVYANRGFFSEAARRLWHAMLPADADESYLRDVLSLVFDRASDAGWIRAVDDAVWLELFAALAFDELGADAGVGWMGDLVEALRVLSYRISAIGLEPELLRVEPTLEAYESPFLGQNAEALALVASWQAWLAGIAERAGEPDDGAHLHVLFDQCRKVVERVRTRAMREGTSLSLTLHLKRLLQLMERTELIIDILRAWAVRRRLDDAATQVISFFKLLAVKDCRKNDLRSFWRDSVELMSRRVTENAGRAGEHYITETRSEYFGMLRSAALAGVVIALMALIKLSIGLAGLPPLVEALSVCLDYGLGFVLIYVLHGTVATKQPAMTAAYIAAAIGDGGSGGGGSAKARGEAMDRLAELIARTVRSQLVAILGNVAVAVPVAIAVGWGISHALGTPYPAAGKAHHMLTDLHPWHSGAVFFAGIGGVCLFLAGLICGYYDNVAAYNRIPQRLLRAPMLRRLLGEARLARVADYLEDHLGALAGNFFFGVLLAGTTAFGVLFGLPVDIRHITLSSAYLGFAANALDFATHPHGIAHEIAHEIGFAALGVALIGMMNLLVSFSLSLWVACRSRGISLDDAAPLPGRVGALLRARTREFFLPPKTPEPRNPPPA